MSGITGGPIRDLIARIGVVVNTFDDLIDHGKAVQGLGFGLVDEFEDETGVDVGASTNETYDATDDFYTNIGAQNLIPFGTGTVIGDAEVRQNEGFDGVTNANSSVSPGGVNGVQLLHLGKDWGVSNTKTLTGFKAYATNNQGFKESINPATITITLQGSSDNFAADVNDLGNVSGGPDASSLILSKLSGLVETTAYRYHRLKIDPGEPGAARTICAEVEFFESDPPVNMTLISNAQTAGVAPAKAQFTALLEAVDTITLNTDCKAYVSSDGGTTYDQLTLKDYGDHGSGIAVVSGEAALTGGGTSMRWKFETLNVKVLRLRAVGVLWN